ncbi:MAG: hypothetical protein IJX24_08035 [Oscillospiraceae bacterium]|nr:hypothetical protein [Oscillospiraceae bacterium]
MTYKKTISLFLAVIFLVICCPFSVNAASSVKGDANGDGILSVSDAAYIARCLSKRKTIDLAADYNGDGKITVADAAEIARVLARAQGVSYAQTILDLVNQERLKVGASPLTLNTSLSSAANVRAVEIADTFSHTRPDGTSFSTALESLNINYRGCGENIAAGQTSAEEVMAQWVASEGHYKNIINPNYTQLGIGYYFDNDSTYKYHWVQLFMYN